MIRLSAFAIVAIVLLRLLTGWHFYNEGIKKLDPDFTSAGFLRTAIGPFAPTFRSMVKGPYGAHVDLAKPVELGSRPEEQRTAIDSWLISYGRRAAEAIKSNEPLPNDIDAAVPGSGWIGNLAASWKAGIGRLDRLGMSDETSESIDQLRDAKLGKIVHYVHGIVPEIEDLQHLEWRLAQLREEAGTSPAPYQVDLIAIKANEIWITMQPWIASVRLIEDEFIKEASAIVGDDGISTVRAGSALAERSMLGWIDLAVTYTVLGCGILMFLGLGVRIVGVIAAGFLLSLILTQPPWVPGADLAAFFTWAIELAAFLVLAGIGAGRWAGLDGLLHAMRVRFGDLSPTYEAVRKPAAPATDA